MLACILLSDSSFCQELLKDQTEKERRESYLEELLELNRPHPTPGERPRNVFSSFERLSFADSTWDAWLQRTGELPPDFSQMPAIPLLPNPLIWDQGGENRQITNRSLWIRQREWISEQVKHWLSGTFPEPPENITPTVLEERFEEGVKVQRIALNFGEHPKAILTIEVFTPPGEGPFPVFMSQWNHRGWVQIAVRRGYMGVIYAGADTWDDTKHYQEVYPEYDWTALMTRAWGASRAVDYLHTLEEVNTEQIALTGHSRNAKLSLFAAAFDPRFKAVISSSGGTGGEIPYRFTDETHENESIDFLNSIRPQWFHPRLRFFNGREHQLPIDQNSLMALIAPNALLLSSSVREAGGGDPWAIEQNFESLSEVYAFLGVPDRLGLRLRDGGHGVSARDIEAYMDWLDIQFDRKKLPWENKRVYPYSFDRYKENFPDPVSLESFPVYEKNPLKKMEEFNLTVWTGKKKEVKHALEWLLGATPPGISPFPIEGLSTRKDYLDQLINRPNPRNGVRRNFAPYNAMGDYQYAALYHPIDEEGQMKLPASGKLPVMIWTHKYVNTGFDSHLTRLFEKFLEKGIAVLTMDMIGYGSRIEEGTLFYERYPAWSKAGKMVEDLKAAIYGLEDLDFINKDQIYLGGHALGGTISLFTGALEEKVAGLAVVAAFTPWRSAASNPETLGANAYSHLYGLIPKLGFFEHEEDRIPVDFPEIISNIAPKPVLVIAPTLDRHADKEHVEDAIKASGSIYSLYGQENLLELYQPKQYNRFTEEMENVLVDWIHQKTKVIPQQQQDKQ
ncbi:glucuronyl esterase domain-containing protein [Pleomorphovibrio marinus]|uniref:glucuronyl esterase domain-containing protein n=1 Tax=Pleomorphovibrio marinus TaxID=2164132 RepID=UPI000E0A2EC1|nr:alpha/beta hydrolase [Pleomorphovibrio marinus]